jgi:glucose/arabinose dehydrogenase
LPLGSLALLAACSTASPGPPAGAGLTVKLLATGLSAPLYVTAPHGDSSRIFIVLQSGQIRVMRHDTLLATPFLDIASRIAYGGEQGLLSLAFHPNYAANGEFFVGFTDTAGTVQVTRYTVSGDPSVADPASGLPIIAIPHPTYTNHNGGFVLFGPEGDLYIGVGDGGSEGDPFHRGQDSTVLLGKMLRIDVDGGSPYAVPPTNPFVGRPPARPEIWAYGLRNPWRFAFDAVTHDLYIADVGQDAVEEVDVQPAASRGGENYGWSIMEGNACYTPPAGCNEMGLTLPVLTYLHGANESNGCAIIGGTVYRGARLPAVVGQYFYGDLCRGWIKSFKLESGAVTGVTDYSASLGLHPNLTSFGVDGRGELYFTTGDGDVGRLEPVGS